jgi:hypothetical protein
LVPFSVADSIETTVVVPFDTDATSPGSTGVALRSPDQSKLLVHTRLGDLGKNVLIESLLLFDLDAISRYVNGKTSAPPAASVVSTVEVRDDWGTMSDIQWLNDGEIGFVAQAANGRAQAFAVDIRSGAQAQLTSSETDVASFAVSGDTVLYYAHVAASRPQIGPITDKAIYDVLFADGPTDTPLELFQLSRSTGIQRRLALPAMRLNPNFQSIWISPSQRFAVIYVPAVDAPAHWAEYRVGYYALFGYTRERVVSDPTSWDLRLNTRFQLVDLDRNSNRPLIDAPAGFLSFNASPVDVFWQEDDKSVIVSNTYVPLGSSVGAARAQKAAQPAIVEIALDSGRYQVIAWQPGAKGETPTTTAVTDPIVRLTWNAHQERLSVARKNSAGSTATLGYRKRKNGWSQERLTADGAAKSALEVRIQQSLVQRPKLVAADRTCRCEKVVFDPNPQADRFSLGRASVFTWKDSNGLSWRGGLILPVGYDPNTRYPLVLQTHGFNPDEFLLDGPTGITSAMAAQPLANAGFVVLQIEDNPRAMTLDEREGHLFAEGIRAAVDELVAKGMAERDRVGLIAFSRTGYHALHILAQSPGLLRAVTISDALQQGYASDLFLLNAPGDAVTQVRELSGGPATAANLCQWFAANPISKLASIRAAVRLEANGPASVLGLWETFALLRGANRAVDFMYFPEGSHVLVKPAERRASQEGNVDWFRFWLRDEEDDSRTKPGQYAAWRKLRELQRTATQ